MILLIILIDSTLENSLLSNIVLHIYLSRMIYRNLIFCFTIIDLMYSSVALSSSKKTFSDSLGAWNSQVKPKLDMKVLLQSQIYLEAR